MEVSQEFAIDLRTKSNRLYQPEQLSRRPLSPQEEKIQLLRKIEAVSASNRQLREKQDSLQSTIYDLRKLLEFVGKESLEECGELHAANKMLERRVDSMARSLEVSHKHGSHVQRCALFWQTFVQ